MALASDAPGIQLSDMGVARSAAHWRCLRGVLQSLLLGVDAAARRNRLSGRHSELARLEAYRRGLIGQTRIPGTVVSPGSLGGPSTCGQIDKAAESAPRRAKEVLRPLVSHD